MVAPSFASRSVTALRRRSEPETLKPRFSRTSAMPLMPMPPMPTKCTRWIFANTIASLSTPASYLLLPVSRNRSRHFRDFASGVGMGKPLRSYRHAGEPGTIFQQSDDIFGQPVCSQLRLRNQHRRTGFLQYLCVASLMVVGGAGKRNKESRFSGSGDLGHRARARATNDQ